MSRLKNIVGQTFGLLTVVKRHSQNNSAGHTQWVCSCECGNTTVATGTNLKSGSTKSCGCLKHKPAHNRLDLVGERFGRLVVLPDGHEVRGKRNVKYWNCQCDCGNTTSVTTGKLRSGHTISCGCWSKEQSSRIAMAYLVGKRSLAPNGTLPPRIKKGGYVKIHDRYHHRADKAGFVFEHIKVMERHLGRKMLPNEYVHHKNGVNNDNRIENLELWVTGQPFGQRINDRGKFYVEFLLSYPTLAVKDVTLTELTKLSYMIENEIFNRTELENEVRTN